MTTQTPLLQFTDTAWQHIQKLLQQTDDKTQQYFYLNVYETGCTGYMYAPSLISEPAETDIAVLLASGDSVYIAKEAIMAVQGTTVDYVTASLGQKQMMYDNPNAEDLCGCGESFNLKPGIIAPGIKRYSGKMHG